MHAQASICTATSLQSRCSCRFVNAMTVNPRWIEAHDCRIHCRKERVPDSIARKKRSQGTQLVKQRQVKKAILYWTRGLYFRYCKVMVCNRFVNFRVHLRCSGSHRQKGITNHIQLNQTQLPTKCIIFGELRTPTSS